MDDPSRVGEARRHAAQLAHDCGFDEVQAGRLALSSPSWAPTWSAMRRKAAAAARAPGRREVEVISIDEGPGIADIDRSLGDGYSTGGTPGTGLGAVRRLAQRLRHAFGVPEGTVVVARVRA
jgi:hypothetical protein